VNIQYFTSIRLRSQVFGVRALDVENVYVHVNWLNPLGDLAGRRWANYNTKEIVPANHMDLCNVHYVNDASRFGYYDNPENNG